MQTRFVSGIKCNRWGSVPGVLLVVVFINLFFSSFTVAEELQTQRLATEHELRELRESIALTEQRRSELSEQIAALDKDRTSLNRTLIDATTKSRSVEKRINKAEARLSQLREEQLELRVVLKGNNALLTEVLAALQRMGRKPPPALLVTPDDALSSVRSAILLGSVVPEMRSETEVLLGQLKKLARVSSDIKTQRENLSTDLATLAEEEERLNLLLQEKQRLAGTAVSQLADESAKAAELAAKANSLQDLIGSLENEIEAVRQAAEAAKIADEEQKKRKLARNEAAKKFQSEEAFSDAGRTAPAITFEQAKGLLPLPVSAEIVTAFGEIDGSGEPSAGINLEARENARVISPADGWIVYAGPFRSYGQLLIINAGQGYHVVLAGMKEINVQPGRFVIVGEPLGKMGASRLASLGQVDVSTRKPILYVEFRQNDKSIDSSPWWAEANLERKTDGS